MFCLFGFSLGTLGSSHLSKCASCQWKLGSGPANLWLLKEKAVKVMDGHGIVIYSTPAWPFYFDKYYSNLPWAQKEHDECDDMFIQLTLIKQSQEDSCSQVFRLHLFVLHILSNTQKWKLETLENIFCSLVFSQVLYPDSGILWNRTK